MGAEFFRKVFPIVDFRTSSLSLSLPLPSFSLSLFHNRVSVRREARVTIREGRARTRPQKYGAAGNADWYL